MKQAQLTPLFVLPNSRLSFIMDQFGSALRGAEFTYVVMITPFTRCNFSVLGD